MKRIGGLFRRVQQGEYRRGPDGLAPAEVLEACRQNCGADPLARTGPVAGQAGQLTPGGRCSPARPCMSMVAGATTGSPPT